ncbi:MAG: co-chaperone GroES [bacterium]
MKIRPLRKQVIIKPITKEEKTKTGIILPDTAEKEKPEQGRVMAIGPKVKEVKKGDLVLFTQYAPNEIKVDGKELLVIKEEDILAIIE